MFRQKVPQALFERLDQQFDHNELLVDLEKIMSCYELSPTKNQICLTSPKCSSNPLHEGCGRAHRSESDYTEFNSEFTNTVFEKIWKTVPYRLGRVRLMLLPPGRCYSYHRDTEHRLHLAIITDPRCHIMLESTQGNRPWLLHIPANGFIYRVATTNLHNAINGSDSVNRIHLVAGILGPRFDHDHRHNGQKENPES